jgi:hypothetical protein
VRWLDKDRPSLGDTRIRRRFLWFPKCIGGEWRWFEYASWREVFREGLDLSPGATGNVTPSMCVFWSAKEWA